MSGYLKASLTEIDPSSCPCGLSRRAFMDAEGRPATVHLLEVSRDTEPHYHKKMLECYTILEGEGWLELDGERVPVKPMDTVIKRDDHAMDDIRYFVSYIKVSEENLNFAFIERS